MDAALRKKLDELPAAPGVYLMKDRRGEVVYVGKAASLRSRVRSYFDAGGGDDRPFIPLLDGLLGDIDVVVTRSEKEAVLLENELIKKHKPRFNVRLRDDKDFIVLRLDRRHPYPRIEVARARQRKEDGARWFGPYSSASSIRETLRLVNRWFQLRTCTDHVFDHRKRPCILYQIDRCPAPCVYDFPHGGVRAQRGRRGGLPGGEGRGADRAAPGAHARGRRGDALRGGGPAARPAPRRGAQPGDAAGPHGRPGRPGRGGHPPRGARPGHPGPLHARRQAPRLPGLPVLRPGVPRGRAALVLPLPPLRAGRAARRGAAPHRAGQRRGAGRGALRAARAQGAAPPPPARGQGRPARRGQPERRPVVPGLARGGREAVRRARRPDPGALAPPGAALDGVLRHLDLPGVDGGRLGRLDAGRRAGQGGLPALPGEGRGRPGRLRHAARGDHPAAPAGARRGGHARPARHRRRQGAALGGARGGARTWASPPGPTRATPGCPSCRWWGSPRAGRSTPPRSPPPASSPAARRAAPGWPRPPSGPARGSWPRRRGRRSGCSCPGARTRWCCGRTRPSSTSWCGSATRPTASPSSSTASCGGPGPSAPASTRSPGIGELRRKALLRHFGSLRRVREATPEEIARRRGAGGGPGARGAGVLPPPRGGKVDRRRRGTYESRLPEEP